jgi:hypothetical protein
MFILVCYFFVGLRHSSFYVGAEAIDGTTPILKQT